jgi:GNAT superfamily N-acetyltransferase
MPTKSSRVVFAVEPLALGLANGLDDLATMNAQEAYAHMVEVPVAVNWPALQMAERRGEFIGISARKAGKLVGYAGYFLRLSTHQGLIALNDSLYLDPSVRQGWTALELLAFAAREMKTRGAVLVRQGLQHSTEPQRHARMVALIARAGYAETETIHTLIL